MPLPTPPQAYNLHDQQELRTLIERALADRLRTDQDIILPYAIRLVLTSPSGSLWALSVDNAGALSAVAYP